MYEQRAIEMDVAKTQCNVRDFFWVWAQPNGDDVDMDYHLFLAEPIRRMIPECM